MQHNPEAPFGAALVNFTSNELITISVNMWGSGDLTWDSYYAHAELVAINNATKLFFPTHRSTGDWPPILLGKT